MIECGRKRVLRTDDTVAQGDGDATRVMARIVAHPRKPEYADSDESHEHEEGERAYVHRNALYTRENVSANSVLDADWYVPACTRRYLEPPVDGAAEDAFDRNVNCSVEGAIGIRVRVKHRIQGLALL